jgi:hypothetical protein
MNQEATQVIEQETEVPFGDPEEKSMLLDKDGKQLLKSDTKPLAKAGDYSQLTGTDALIAMALEKDLDMDKLERLFQMKEHEEEKTAKSLFNVAMAKVQNLIQPIITDAENDHTGSRYAKLVAIIRTLAPIYTEHGFSVSYGQARCDDEALVNDKWFRTTSELSHAGGHTRSFYVDLPADIHGAKGNVNKTLIHGTKSTITYARGILMGLMFNFTTSDDVDNDGCTSAPVQKEPATDKQMAQIEDYRAEGKIPEPTETWIKKNTPLTKEMADGLLRKLKAAEGEK